MKDSSSIILLREEDLRGAAYLVAIALEGIQNKSTDLAVRIYAALMGAAEALDGCQDPESILGTAWANSDRKRSISFARRHTRQAKARVKAATPDLFGEVGR